MGLVLRRNVGQSVTIYSTVDKSLGVVTITTRGHGVMEIDAPKNLAVMRSELLDEPIVSERSELGGKGPEQASSVKQALEFVCRAISEAETIREVDRHGSRAEAIASKAHEMHSRCLEALGGESQPVTKKLGEILHERPHLKVTGIRRLDADCEQIYATAMLGRLHLEMTWHDNWHAWSCRPATGIYQQIIIFMPRSSDD
jgi:sRNA-binding carbon storage regulator CsrA